jgi:hypothetical protein
LAERIRNHRLAGPYVREWQDEGIIPVGAKIVAMTMMAAMLGYLVYSAAVPRWLEAAAGIVILAAAIFILTRPSRRAGNPD